MGRASKLAVGKLTLSVAVALLVFGAIPAGATIYERGRINDEYTRTDSDCGFPVRVEGTATGQYRVRTGKGKTASAFFQRVTVRYREVHTNTVTGEWFLVRGHRVFNEVKARRVEGNVFRFTAVEAGQPFVVENSAGEVVYRDRGAIRYTILFDTLGDAVPGGEFIREVDVRVNGPHPGFERDFCEIVSELIGP
ncbi:MAG: hypothetical protein M3304_05185 [Actinomycetota bacterium]|nr:hypothetical protein [Actinomycetota bacterium]